MGNNPDKRKLNLIPVFGDLGTLVLGVFILIIIDFTIQLKEIPKNIEIPTKDYFKSGSDTLTTAGKRGIADRIRTHFDSINVAFQEDRLVKIVIEGHTDPKPLKEKKGRPAKNNLQLSYLRAEQVYYIFEGIIRDKVDDKKENEFIDKIQIVGKGPGLPGLRKYGFKLIDSEWVVFKRIAVEDSLDEVPFDHLRYKDKNMAMEKTYELQRRVEIVPTIKGG